MRNPYPPLAAAPWRTCWPAGPGLHARLRNRVVMGSMHTGLEDRLWDFGKLAAYYRRRPGQRRADRHRRLRALPRRLAAALRRQPHQRPGGARPSSR